DASGQEYFILNPINPEGKLITTGAPIKVIKEKGAVMLQKEPEDCEKTCKGKKWNDGGCVTAQEAKERIINSEPAHRLERSVKCANPDEQCYCWGPTVPKGEKPDPPDNKDTWNYRYDKLGYYYDKLKYYSGRDFTACFGLNDILYPYNPYISPGESSLAPLQCLCTSQIRNRLVLLRNIIQGVYNCLQQVKTTGKANTGVCKEIFTQYVCKWLYQIVSYFMNGCVPWVGTGKEETISDIFKAGSQSIFGAVEEATSDLMSDYDNAALRDYLGVGEGAVVEKVCLGALTGDWGIDLRGIMDAAYSQPFHTSVSVPFATREYLTWNPSTWISTYEYKVPWMIAAGCKIDSYTVSLSCVSPNEYGKYDGIACGKAFSEKAGTAYNSPDGCDCMHKEGMTEKTRTIYTGRNIAQGTFEDKSVHITSEEMQRYDHVKIKLFINDPKLRDKCLPDGHKDGIFYFPLTDITAREVKACRYDLQSGTFVCDQGQLLWNLRGTAYFGAVRCGNEPCETKVYYIGDAITLNPLEVYAQGKTQCLVAQITNKYGRNLLGPDAFLTIPVNETQVTFSNLALTPISSIDASHLRSVGATIRKTAPLELESHILSAYEFNEPEIKPGNYYAYFWNDNGQLKYLVKRVDDTKNYIKDDFTSFNEITIIKIGGVAVRFRQPQIPAGANCREFDLQNCQRYTFEVIGAAEIAVEEEQTWKIHLELRYAPGENNEGPCAESSPNDIINFRGELQKKDINIRVKPLTRAQAIACKSGEGSAGFNAGQCNCNGDADTTDAEDCDGSTKKYCYNNVCRPYPKCPENKEIQEIVGCDCDWNGTLNNSSGQKCEGLGKRYCYDSNCNDAAKPPNTS
ncbi:MAG: hypothetical protein QXH80_05160, partial [Candidatus Nanoarchaeia archaeon]